MKHQKQSRVLSSVGQVTGKKMVSKCIVAQDHGLKGSIYKKVMQFTNKRVKTGTSVCIFVGE